ncbi:hypothetical protein [Streptomyces sp. M92]|uniref:hypothetical protein n=1 Tax=Streptomyces sp. M92 TaxID=2944250 RepID=UPI00234915B1|nr:hypothetical protein [Streptomyces sp. M92]WCN07396.1 hypothetical protein M6G08_35750 [Streptomyces sp. M92]
MHEDRPVELVSHLVDVIRHDERREGQVRAELLRQIRADPTEPPTAAQVNAITRSALHRLLGDVLDRVRRRTLCGGLVADNSKKRE